VRAHDERDRKKPCPDGRRHTAAAQTRKTTCSIVGWSRRKKRENTVSVQRSEIPNSSVEAEHVDSG